MNYVLIDFRGIVVDIIKDDVPAFPGILAVDRIPEKILHSYKAIDPTVLVAIGWKYLDDGTFEEVPQEDTPIDDPKPPTPVPTVREVLQDTDALAVDHEYRLVLLELGVM